MLRSPRLLPHALLAAAVVLAAAVLVVVPVGAPAAQAATFTAGLTGIAGTSDDFGNQNGMSATQVASGATGGGLTKVSLYIGAVNAAPANHGQVAVYSDVNDLPGVKLAASGSQVLAAKAWNDFPLAGPSIAASTKYWLVFNVDGANTKYKITGGGRAAWQIPTPFGTWPDQFGAPSPGADGERYAINMTWDSAIVPPTTATETSTPPPSTTTPPPTTTTAPPPPPGPRACPPLPAHPNQDCTGTPPGTQLAAMPLVANEIVANGQVIGYGDGAVQITHDNVTIDGYDIPGDVVVRAANVTIKNSHVVGTINDEYGDGYHGPYSVIDTTIGPDEGCYTQPAMQGQGFTATRVWVHNHDNGFQAAGDGHVLIEDSFAQICSVGDPNDSEHSSHADGFQAFCFDVVCYDLKVIHSTLDDRNLSHTTALYDVPGTGKWNESFEARGNLLLGGTYTILLEYVAGPDWIVDGNSVVDGAWDFGPASAENTCAHQVWTNNQIVTMNPDYSVASVVAPLDCIE